MKSQIYYQNECLKTLKHSCPEIILGVRMAMLGCDRIGVNPSSRNGKSNLLVYVESERCLTDAISIVTGCRIGMRTMKFFDYGISAATFLDPKTKRSVRVLAKDSGKQTAETHIPRSENNPERLKKAYAMMSDAELFDVQDELTINVDFYDLPGMTKKRIACDSCGVIVNDNRQVVVDKNVYCRPCYNGGYWVMLPSA